MVALSIDPPGVTVPWITQVGLTMPMLSDPEMKVIEGLFHVRNPKEPDLAIHAIYLIDTDGRIFYRKIGRRRPRSPELLDAFDYHAKTKAP